MLTQINVIVLTGLFDLNVTYIRPVYKPIFTYSFYSKLLIQIKYYVAWLLLQPHNNKKYIFSTGFVMFFILI